MKTMPNKPNERFFLILGAQKAGSASLKNFLSAHPNLQCAVRKEVNFFSSDVNFARGSDWYYEQFPDAPRKTLFYEATPEYLYYPFVPGRIKAFNPHIKMLVILREPVERAYSAWNMFKKLYYNNRESLIKNYFSLSNPGIREAMTEFLELPRYKSFEDCVADEPVSPEEPEPSFVRRGIYWEQLERYYRHFSREQILIIENRELRNNKTQVLDSILDFLRLPTGDWENHQLDDSNKGIYDEPIPDEIKRKLKAFYKPHNEKLYRLIDKEYNW
jgi:hypothetical protein